MRSSRKETGSSGEKVDSTEVLRPVVTCASCRYVDKTDEQKPFCRRYPATLVPTDVGPRALYPVVTLDRDWCGEHKRHGVGNL